MRFPEKTLVWTKTKHPVHLLLHHSRRGNCRQNVDIEWTIDYSENIE